VVDDKPENLFSLTSVLNLHNFQVETAESGEEALKKVLNNSYSLIILDVQMPGMDGFEVAEAINGYSKAKDTPIIFLSAVSKDKRFISKGYTSGCVDYVTKPVDPDILLLKVKTFYRLSEQRRELIRVQKSLQTEIDIRKQAQSELELRMEELFSVLEALPQIAFTIKTNGAIEYVNEEWYKYSTQQHLFPEAHPDYINVYKRWEESFRRGNKFVSEIRIRRIDTGTYPYHLLRIIPVKQGQTILKWVGTFTDIHHQKEVNEMLEKKVGERTQELISKNEELEVKNNELQQFAWVASHDLKEPLRKIQTYNYLIRDKLEEYHSVAPYIDRTIQSSKRMSEMIDNLLRYARLSVLAPFEPTDLNVIVEEILSDLEIVIAEKQAIVTVGKLPVIDCVPSQLRQVFQNLVSNSLKFTRPGVVPEVSVTADIIGEKSADAVPVPEGSFCRIIVNDNGIGFNEKYLDRIFLIFQRLHNPRVYEGIGIGLSITKKIVERHNGLITAKSAENEGSDFIIVLPLSQDQPANNITRM